MASKDFTLTQEILKELLRYNPETGVFVWKVKAARCVEIGDIAGCLARTGYNQIKVAKKSYRAHRLAFLYMTGSFPPNQIDHINHIRDDNQWLNLRAVTHQENHKNRTKNKNNTAGITGVSWHKHTNKWYSRIKVNYIDIYLGIFDDWFDAVCARKSAENKYGFHPGHGRKL